MKPIYSLLFFLLGVVIQVSGQAKLHVDTSYFGSMFDIRTFKNKKMIKHVIIDTTGELMYQAPLLPTQKAPAFKFVSGRSYYEKGKTDTIVFEKNIPQMNLNVQFGGGTFRREGMYTYIIMDLWPQPGTQQGKMVIDVNENVFEGEKYKKAFHKVVLIDIR